ncbi:MAG: hypothetical protein ABJF04_23420 [Reichenbachiella sp.]|uniref:hypothetical protein n=1 Tax=Reichenbachiella sp. TaxID=2184521 RepID=UPI003267F556
MKTSNTQIKPHKADAINEDLLSQCQAMLKYAIRQGKQLNTNNIQSLDHIIDLTEVSSGQKNTDQLVALYNYLITVVNPAKPSTIALLESSSGKDHFLSFLGPIPIFRQFMVVTVLSILLLIGLSLLPELNARTIQISILQGSGTTQLVLLTFLVASASLGTCFNTLFKMNGYLTKGTFDSSYNFTYWSRFCLGIVAGLLLSEFFVNLVDSTASNGSASTGDPLASLSYLLKPVLAMVGGFSANLVYQILNQLVNALEGVFKLNTKELIKQKAYEFQLKSEQQANNLRNESAKNLLELKQKLAGQNLSGDVMDHLDSVLSNAISGNTILSSKGAKKDSPKSVVADSIT